MTDTGHRESGAYPHVDFDVIAQVGRLVWVGPMPIGVSGGEPRVSVDGTELRAPIRPSSADSAFGLNRPGFGVRFREGS